MVRNQLVRNGEERTPDKNGGKISRLYQVINGPGTEKSTSGVHKMALIKK